MTRRIVPLAVATAVIGIFSYLPFPGMVASAQTAQNTIYSYQYNANGKVTQVTDPLGRVANFTYDVLGRSTQQTLPAPQPTAARPVIQYSYDGQNQLSTVTDPRNLVTTYTVDGLGNQTALDSPDTAHTADTYDLAGNLTTRTDARGKTTTYTYDALNRVTRIAYGSGQPTVFEYDGGVGGVGGAIGQMTGMADESGSTVFSYDAFGRLSGKAQTAVAGSASSTLRISYVYGTSGTGIGKLASITYPSGNRVNYLYNDAGQLYALTLDPADDIAAGTNAVTSVDLLTGIAYAPFGGVQSWYWGNSTVDAVNGYARTFDLDGRLTSYTLGNVQTTGVLRHITYDAAGRILAYAHEGPSLSPAPVVLDQTFAYDDLDRLTSNQSANISLGFSYDANGNRTQATIGGGSYSNTVAATSNRLLSTTGPAPAKGNIYDAAGNLTSDGTASYTYSDRGRLARALKAGLTTDYLYNGLGQRVSKAGAAVLTGINYFAYDEQGHLLGEYAANGAALQETVYLGDTPVVVLANGVSYVYADHLDAPRLITHAADNAILWRWDQADPFGVQPPLENPSGLGNFSYNLRFPGQLFDRETNNHYNYFRDYDPQTGRYIQSDPIGLEGGINTYAYVGGDPVSYFDASGLNRTRAPTNGPTFHSAQVALITSQIRTINPSFTYQTIRPSSGQGSGYNQNDVSALSRILRDYQKNSQTNRDGVPVGRFICDARGNTMVEPVGGNTVPWGRNGQDTHTRYSNNSNYMRMNPEGHPNNPTPHGHGHLQGTGTGRGGQGPSLDIFGNVVPSNSGPAHWPIN